MYNIIKNLHIILDERYTPKVQTIKPLKFKCWIRRLSDSKCWHTLIIDFLHYICSIEYPCLNIVTVPREMAGLERKLNYRSFRLQRFLGT